MPNLPTLIDSRVDAVSMGKKFRNHVETIVRGDRPRRSHAWAPPSPVARSRPLVFQSRNRAIRIMAKVIRHQRERRQLEAQEVQDTPRYY